MDSCKMGESSLTDGGDFNITHFLGERCGTKLHIVSMAAFNDLIIDLSLIEALPL